MCEQYLDAFQWYSQMGRISRERVLAVLWVAAAPATSVLPQSATTEGRPCIAFPIEFP